MSLRFPVPHPRRPAPAVLSQLQAAIVLALLPSATPAGEYRLAPGDVLRVSVMGAPELTQDVPVEMDGSAWFPLVGPIAADGMTLGDLRDSAAGAYATSSLGWTVDPGRSLLQPIEKQQVHVSVAEYRAIYVSGDAVGGREIPFRPGMTLGHVLALASGGPPGNCQGAACSAEIDATALALAHEQARVWRLKAFLGVAEEGEDERLLAANLPGLAAVIDVERSILEESRVLLATQTGHLRGEVERLAGRIAMLERQLENERDGLAMDEADLAKVSDLFDRGLVPASRIADVRRAVLVTGSRALDVEAALENARAQAAQRRADIPAAESAARTRAWEELGAAMLRVEERRAALSSLTSAGARHGVEPTATVTRDGVALASAEPSLALWPGDIVEIRQRSLVPPADTADPEARG